MSDIAYDAVEQDAPGADDEDGEALARASGWRPLAEYRGRPEDWKDWPEFLEVGEREAPVMRQQNRMMQRKLATQDRELQGLKLSAAAQDQAIAELTRLARRADQRGYDRAMTELDGRREEAVEAGDTAAFKQIDEQMKTLEKEFAAPPPAPPPPPVAEQPRDPAYAAFESSNPWIKTDRALAQSMLAHHTIVMNQNPTWSIARQLAEARRRLVADYPARFEQDDDDAAPGAEEDDDVPQRPTPRAPSVARPGGMGRPRPNARSGFDVIEDPAERSTARAAFAAAKRAEPDLTEGEWLALYDNPKADVLELRRQFRPKK